MNARTKNFLGVWFLAAVAAVLIAVIPTCGHAASVAEWERLNDLCRGAQIEPDRNPDCARREREARALIKAGYIAENHDVWVSQDQYRAWRLIFRTYGAQGQQNVYSLMSIMPAMMQAMARAVPLPQLFAIWNDPDIRAWARDASPAGWAMMSEGMHQIENAHAQENNVLYTLDTQ